MKKLLLSVALLLLASLDVFGQAGGVINGTRGFPQANDGTTGTVLAQTAIVNSSGNAILAGVGNTSVPTYIVVGGAGTTGNAVLAAMGTIAPCQMDATNASGAGGFYVVNSTTVAGQCHAQPASPSSGVWVIGYLHDSSTTSGANALVSVSGYVFGSASGVSSFTGDGGLISNTGSTGPITVTLVPVPAHQYWGNSTGATAAPGYHGINVNDLPSGITNAKLQNSSITINTTAPLGGGGAVSLGATLTLTCATCLTDFTAGVNPQTVNYTLISGDDGKLVTFNGASLTATLPASPPSSLWSVKILNLNASGLTISRNALQINGGTSNITLPQFQAITISTDGANYFTSTVPVSVSAPITLTPTSSGLALACTACGVTSSGLNQFAATTSAQLAGVLSDELGTGKAVFASALQGTDANLLTAGTISGASIILCTDANGGATTAGCPSATLPTSPTSPNSVPYVLTSTPSGGVGGTAAWSLMGVSTNAQTGTTYTIAAVDRTSYLSFSNASSIAVTLPQAGTTNFASNFPFISCGIGAGTTTITPTTSTISYSDGVGYHAAQTTLPLTTGQCAWVFSDNSNYFAAFLDGNAGAVNGAAVPASATVLGSNGSRQLISQTVSGTGNVCMTTNCVMTTPNLGVPSALTLTNALGLPLGGLLAEAANTTVANVTSGSAFPTAVAIPSGIQNYVAGTGYNQATGHQLEASLVCADSSGSGTAQVCNTSPSFTPAAGDTLIYTTTTTNSGTGLTVNVDSLGAKSVAIAGASGWTTTLTASIIPPNKNLLMVYDGTNWNVQQTGTAATGGGGVSSFTGDGVLLSNSGSTGAVTDTLALASAGMVLGNATNSSAAPTYHTLSAINPQTATYSATTTDFSAYKTITVASGTFTITLPSSGSQPGAGQYINVVNYGSGVLTIARNGQNINGAAANFTLNAGSASAPTSAQIWSDGTNYSAQIDQGTVGTVTNAASLTNNAVVIGGGLQAISTIAADTTTTHALMATAGAPAFRALVASDIPTAIPIANVGSAGLSATSPVTIASTGVIACSTCNTTSAVANPPLDKSGTGLSNPTADATFTQPIGSTVGITLNGTAPASVATATGTNATAVFNVAGVTGGADSNATGTAGTGSQPTWICGNGGAATGINGVGGQGGNCVFTAGNGGASLGTGANSNAGNVIAIPGLAGTGGSGTAGKAGVFQVGSSAPFPVTGTAGGSMAGEGTAPTGLSANDTWYANSTNHCFDLINQTTDVGCAVAVGQANTYGNFLQDFSGGTIRVPTSVAGVTNIAGTFQAGADATTTGATAAITLRGEDVTGGSTASLAGGAATLRGGDNASTGNSNAGGAVTVRGGDATGGTGTTDTGGTLTGRGGNCTSTTGSCTPGAASVTAGGFTAAFTNGAASDTTIAAGLGTGNAAVSHVKIQSPALSQTSGTTAQTQVTRYVTHVKAGSTTSATATNMFNVALANSQTAGFLITVHVETTQATPHNCSTTETFVAAVQDTGGTVTSQTTAGTIGTICDTGTLTLAAAFSAAAPSVFSITPTWATIVPTAVTITIQIQNLSQQEVALL